MLTIWCSLSEGDPVSQKRGRRKLQRSGAGRIFPIITTLYANVCGNRFKKGCCLLPSRHSAKRSAVNGSPLPASSQGREVGAEQDQQERLMAVPERLPAGLAVAPGNMIIRPAGRGPRRRAPRRRCRRVNAATGHSRHPDHTSTSANPAFRKIAGCWLRRAPLLLLEHRRSPITLLPPNLDEIGRASRLTDGKGCLMGGGHPRSRAVPSRACPCRDHGEGSSEPDARGVGCPRAGTICWLRHR